MWLFLKILFELIWLYKNVQFSQSDSNDCLFYIMPLVLEMDKGNLNKG